MIVDAWACCSNKNGEPFWSPPFTETLASGEKLAISETAETLQIALTQRPGSQIITRELCGGQGV